MTAKITDNAELATSIVIAWIANPHSRPSADDAAGLLGSVNSALGALATSPTPVEPSSDASASKPSISAKASLKIDGRIISMIDGKPYSSLTRHLKSYGLTPTEYRQRFGLKADYPMVAPAYSEARRAIAKQIGLGRKTKQKPASKASGKAAGMPAAKGRLPAAEAKKAALRHLGSGEK